MSGKHKLISDQLRDAIGASGETRYRISKETSIAQSALSRFMSGERGLTSSAIDTLCEYLNLELMKRKRRKRT
ncbi:MAG: helix-turn-helix domain-containing protein [Planctomycetaceae bacterium]|nr:helix-turn-helix domain-containing protein [Planctomycetaceae bacterium]